MSPQNSSTKSGTAKPLKYALRYAVRHLYVLPMHGVLDGRCTCGNPDCDRSGKHPRIKGGVNSATKDRNQVREWWRKWPDSNIGIATGDASGLFVLDIDPRHGGDESLAKLEAELGELPETVMVSTGGGGRHLYFAASDVASLGDTAGKLLGPGLDLLGNGRIAIAPPSRHSSGKQYRFVKGRNLLKGAAVLELPDPWKQRLRQSRNATTTASRSGQTSGLQPKIPEGSRNESLMSLGGHLVNQNLSDEAVLECLMMANQNRCEPPLEEAEVRRIAESVVTYRPAEVTTVTGRPEYIAKALLLAEHFEGGRHLRHLGGHGYHRYDGTKWAPVDVKAIEKLALKVIEERPASDDRKPTSVVSDVMQLMAIKLSSDPKSLYGDSHLPVINCANGELWIGDDGEVDFRPHSPESNLTACLAVNYDPEAKSPRYDHALRQIFSESKNPKAMVKHFNEVAGYLIQTKRDIPLILMFLGGGANGKTELWTTLTALIGNEFVHSGSLDQLEKSRFAIGFLRGKLLFVDDDIRSGAKLPDGVLKKLSEGKLLTGELKGQNAFQFINRAVPILLCNNEPTTSDLSYGMERRMMVIPFKHRFLEGKDLDRSVWPAIRREELSGILNRYVSGLQRVRKRGSVFKPPKDVIRAKRRWFRNANPLKAFLHERTVRDAKAKVYIKTLFDAYNVWAEDNGITYHLQRNTMKRQLQQLRFNIGRLNDGNAVVGLKLKS